MSEQDWAQAATPLGTEGVESSPGKRGADDISRASDGEENTLTSDIDISRLRKRPRRPIGDDEGSGTQTPPANQAALYGTSSPRPSTAAGESSPVKSLVADSLREMIRLEEREKLMAEYQALEDDRLAFRREQTLWERQREHEEYLLVCESIRLLEEAGPGAVEAEAEPSMAKSMDKGKAKASTALDSDGEELEDDSSDEKLWNEDIDIDVTESVSSQLGLPPLAVGEYAWSSSQLPIVSGLILPKPTANERGLVDCYDWLYWHTMDSLFRLYGKKDSNGMPHPMFGEPEVGTFRLPLQVQGVGRGLPSSWQNKARQWAIAVAKHMGGQLPVAKGKHAINHEPRVRIYPNSCWLYKGDPSVYVKKGAEVLFRVNILRFYAFLANPSEANWKLVNWQGKASASKVDLGQQFPFLHFCNNGASSEKAREKELVALGQTVTLAACKLGCINGFLHGVIGTVVENNGMKSCGHPGKTQKDCPGHGKRRDRCIYVVMTTGVPRFCRNSITPIPKAACVHDPNCYIGS